MKIETRKICIFFVLLALVLSFVIGIKRTIVENNFKQIDMTMSLTKIRELSIKEGYDENELLKETKSKGITAIAIQEDTVSTLVSQGKIVFFSTNDLSRLNYLEDLNLFEDGNTYNGKFAIACKDYYLFQRIKNNLQTYFGENSIKTNIVDEKYYVITLQCDEEELMKLGLGFSEDDIKKIHELGFNLILRPKNTPKMNPDIFQQKMSLLEEFNNISALIFDEEEVLGYPSASILAEMAKYLEKHNLPFGIIEFTSQKGIQNLSSKIGSLAIRVHSITKEEMEKINLNKAVERWVRAAQERNIRIFYLNPFMNIREEGLVDSNLYYIEKVKDELILNNFIVGKASTLTPYQVPALMIYLIGLGVISAGILLLKELFNFSNKYEILLLIFLFLSLFFIKKLFGLVFLMKMLALATAILFPTLAIIMNKEYFINKITIKNEFQLTSTNQCFSFIEILKRIIFGITKIMLISLSGGLLISALLTNYQFMLAIQLFSGIKIAFLLPIILVISYLWWIEKNNNKTLIEEIKKPILFEHALLFLIIALFGVIYITRSGNFSFVSISSIEEKIRIFLEKYLIARPRNKEFLIGYPLLSLAIAMNYLKFNYLKIPIIAIGTVAPITVVNTFCHIHSPLLFSMLRTFNGYWLGLLFSILMIIIIIYSLRLYRTCLNGKRKRSS